LFQLPVLGVVRDMDLTHLHESLLFSNGFAGSPLGESRKPRSCLVFPGGPVLRFLNPNGSLYSYQENQRASSNLSLNSDCLVKSSTGKAHETG
jgi:hypothetical protein